MRLPPGAAPRVADLDLILPDWPAPAGVRAAVTTRSGGVSGGPFASLNLGDHVGDDPQAVASNRARLRAALRLPAEPLWLEQVHGAEVARFGGLGDPPRADAAVTDRAGEVCAVMVADCLPVLFASRSGGTVGIAHAGWRGLAAGVLERTIEAMAIPPGDVMAWLGPAIGPEAFEVGDEVRAAFCEQAPAAGRHFVANARGRWWADLAGLARDRLAGAGVTAVYGGGPCTFADPGRFFSYRRDGMTGRFAALIWQE
jgi:polyphenol oxidase